MRYLGNAFSLGMLDSVPGDVLGVIVEHITLDQAQAWIACAEWGPWVSCVGHADTAVLLSSMLGVPVTMRRESTRLTRNDVLLVAQYNGPRLPEGATRLPEGAKIRWYLVHVRPPIFPHGRRPNDDAEEVVPVCRQVST